MEEDNNKDNMEENNKTNTAEEVCDPPKHELRDEEPLQDECVQSESGNVESIETEEGTGNQIRIESIKSTLSPRPWKLGAIQIPTKAKDGSTREAWVAAVIDANGRAVCCGDSVDMEFILKLENSYDEILKLINACGIELSKAVDVLQDFECRKTKAFRFN